MTQWNSFFARRTELTTRSAIRELLKLTIQPEVISFAGGLPAPELFPVERIRQATNTVLAQHGPEALQYSTTEGMLQTLKPYDLTYLPVTTDADGMRIEAIPVILRQQPKLMYVVPTYQNPQGTTLTKERRLGLIHMLEPYPVPLVEDNPYSELCYTGEVEPSLMEFDAQSLGIRELNGRVIYTSIFSKILSPGLRVGWIEPWRTTSRKRSAGHILPGSYS